MKAFGLLVCFLACSYGLMAKERINTNTVGEALAQIDSTFYGKLLLDTIDLQLTTSGAIQDIVDLLNEIIAELEFAQGEADAKNKTDQAHCDNQTAKHEGNIAEATRKINTAQSSLDDVLYPHLAQLIDVIANTEAAIVTNKADTAKAIDERAADAATFAERDAEHTEAVAACEEGAELINQLYNQPEGGAVLLQSASKTFKTIEKKFSNLRMGSAYTPMIKALIQLASSQDNLSDQSIVTKIIDLINELKADLESSQGDLQYEEAAAIDAHLNYLDKMANELAALETKLANKQAEKAATEGEIATQEGIVATQTDYRANQQNLLDLLTQDCADKSFKYLDESAQRAEEIDLCGEVRVIFENLEEDMTQYLKDRVDA